MPGFTSVSLVPRDPATTFGYIVDLANWPLFTGYGPLPGIRRASLPEGQGVRLGARIHVDDADGRDHHEVVEVFEPPHRITLRMELVPPAAFFMANILEEMTLEPVPGGTRLTRVFTATPRLWLTWPFAWLFGSFLLGLAVDRHNRAVARAMEG